MIDIEYGMAKTGDEVSNEDKTDFTDKVVLVTGSNTGIGEAIVKQFAQLGAQVVITGRNASRIQTVAQEVQQLSPKGLKPLQVVADLTKSDQLKALLDKTIETFGKLDILVNNADEHVKYSYMKKDDFMDNFDKTLNICLRAVAELIHLSVPYLEITNGTIINMAAVEGVIPDKQNLQFSIAKSGVIMMTRILSIELSPKIRVNCVSPGVVLTQKFIQDHPDNSLYPLSEVKNYIPLKRLAKPSEIAKSVLFLASNDSEFITGANLIVDGGESNQFN